jgi:hypothetical protein
VSIAVFAPSGPWRFLDDLSVYCCMAYAAFFDILQTYYVYVALAFRSMRSAATVSSRVRVVLQPQLSRLNDLLLVLRVSNASSAAAQEEETNTLPHIM